MKKDWGFEVRKRRIVIAGVIASFCFVALPTSNAASSPSPIPSATNPYGGGSVDSAGPNESILTLTNGALVKKFTMQQLIALHPTVISIYEPFVKKRQKFTVVSLSVLFKLVGIKSGSTVITKALNDYVYSNKAVEFTSALGYLAIKRNGVDIPYDQGGPIRIVYPDSSKWAKSLDPWNWSLNSISVKK